MLHHTLGILLAGLTATAGALTLPTAAVADTPTAEPPAGTADGPMLDANDEDPTLKVDDGGAVYAVDLWHKPEQTATANAAATETAAAETAAYSLADTFSLHSRPGSPKTVFLDFDGGVVSKASRWDGVEGQTYYGWSIDGSASFSDAEKRLVQEVWARVAEDFAPFDINVTTAEPPASALYRSSSYDKVYGARVALTNQTSIQTTICGGGCGGVAYVGTFDANFNDETYGPAWVFPKSLGTSNAKNLAEAASHEVGHNLGLSHDGLTNSAYYSGGSLWGPIMGSPYQSQITQWSRGDYVSANNQQDDFVVMAHNGAVLRPDEAGGSATAAVPLTSMTTGEGVIAGAADQDWFAMTDCAGRLTAGVQPVATGPNLDLRLSVVDGAGQVLASSAPATKRVFTGVSGLDAAVDVPLSGGPFYLVVAGTGSGQSWADGGYDAYGSAGFYHLTVNGCGAAIKPRSGVTGNQPPTTPPTTTSGDEPTSLRAPGRTARPRVQRGARGGRPTIVVRWARPARTGGATVNRYRLKASKVDRRGRVVAKRTLKTSGRKASWRLPRGAWRVEVQARNSVGWGRLSRASARVSPR